MKVSDFDYFLPRELIAQEPPPRRDESRLMVVPRAGEIEHRAFRDLVDYVGRGDVMVLNDTRVMRARLCGSREGTGGRVEILLLSRVDDLDRDADACENAWEVLVRPGKKAQPGERLLFGPRLSGHVVGTTPYGGRIVRFSCEGDFDDVIQEIGRVPLPPYIKKEIDDPERYQTVYAANLGSAAAPTAGLHFTREILDAVADRGTTLARITLHVGLGTFRPVRTTTVEEHRMHAEHFIVSEGAAEAVNRARAAGGRVVAVGTTTVRALESLPVSEDGTIRASSGWTTKFIYPGYRFHVTDALLTNFHLPRSTLLMLACAFGGRERVLSAYGLAVKEGYRFFSFGDAMLLL